MVLACRWLWPRTADRSVPRRLRRVTKGWRAPSAGDPIGHHALPLPLSVPHNGQPALTTWALRPRSMMMMMMQTDAAGQDMDIGEVLAVLADLTEAGCSVWVVGGWGVDALVGRQTRLHRDLDLALDADNETVALRVLERRATA